MKYLYFFVQHFMGWPILEPTIQTTAEEVKVFVREELLQPFGAPTSVVGGNATCFTSEAVQHFMNFNDTE